MSYRRTACTSLAERVGFEPTAPFSVTGFQDRLLKPLGHLSKHMQNALNQYSKQPF
jgi:hypothetical protein